MILNGRLIDDDWFLLFMGKFQLWLESLQFQHIWFKLQYKDLIFKHCHLFQIGQLNPLIFVTLHVHVSACFRSFLANLASMSNRRTNHPSSSLETAWQTAVSLIHDIITNLVFLTPLQVVSSNRRPSPLSSFIQYELETVSQQIRAVSSITSDLEWVLDGHAAATPSAVDSLKSLASRQLPLNMASNSHQDLSGWIRDLQQRSVNLPRSDEDCAVFDVSVFGHPEGFLDAVVRHLARRQFKSLHSVHLTVDAVRSTVCSSCLILPYKNWWRQLLFLKFICHMTSVPSAMLLWHVIADCPEAGGDYACFNLRCAFLLSMLYVKFSRATIGTVTV